MEKYKDKIEEVLKRGVKIFISYGIKSFTKKPNINEEAKQLFQEWENKYNNFKVSNKNNSHAKVLIFDKEWAIIGSFNWLSFGKDKQNENVADESSILTKNKETVKKELEKLKT